MMRKSWLALALLAWSFPAFAQSSYVIKDGAGATQTVKSINCSSQICPLSVPGDPAGAALPTAPGTGNNAFALPVQGVAGGVAVPVSGAFWQTTQPVSAASWPLPTGAATQTTLASILSALGSPFQAGGSVGVTGSVAVTGTFWPYALGQQVAGSSVPVVLTAAQLTTLTPPTSISVSNFPSTQAVTGTFWPYTLGQQVAGSSVPVVLTAAQLATLTPPAAITNYANETGGNLAQVVTDLGAPGAAACSTDTASCSQNQQLQRLAQRLTSLITALGTPFQAGGSIGNTTFASTQSGTWTIQPGNTPNTSPWLFSESQGGNTTAVKAASTPAAQADPATVVRNPDIGTLTDTAGCGSSSTVSGCLKQIQANSAALVSGLLTPPLAVTGSTGSDGGTTITSGGTAQNLFSGATPTNGFEVCNPDATEDLWISMNTTALANGQGSERVPPNGGCFDSPATMKPFHAISVVGATTSHKISAAQW